MWSSEVRLRYAALIVICECALLPFFPLAPTPPSPAHNNASNNIHAAATAQYIVPQEQIRLMQAIRTGEEEGSRTNNLIFLDAPPSIAFGALRFLADSIVATPLPNQQRWTV